MRQTHFGSLDAFAFQFLSILRRDSSNFSRRRTHFMLISGLRAPQVRNNDLILIAVTPRSITHKSKMAEQNKLPGHGQKNNHAC